LAATLLVLAHLVLALNAGEKKINLLLDRFEARLDLRCQSRQNRNKSVLAAVS
jgi:hypothetical protein